MEFNPERCIKLETGLKAMDNLLNKHEVKLDKLLEEVAIMGQKLKQTTSTSDIKAIQAILDKHDEQIDKLTEISAGMSRKLEHVTTKLDSFLDDFDNRMKSMVTSLFFSTFLLLIGAVASLKIFLK